MTAWNALVEVWIVIGASLAALAVGAVLGWWTGGP